jgi:hypothetical protein|tara:strand:+ start:142 stop:591 length:450 start_codon:yes stop_codon:yes gene_type:complete
MGRVFFNTRENIQNITADHTVLASDSGSTFIVLPAGTTEITLPTPGTGVANAQEGWSCTIILQSDSGFGGDTIMDEKVNINMVSTQNVGLILAVDGDAGDQAVDADDYIACTAAASPGDRFEFLSDGTRYFVHGLVADASETPFAQAAG